MATQYNFRGNEQFEKERQSASTIGHIFGAVALGIFIMIVATMANSTPSQSKETFIGLGVLFMIVCGIGNHFADKAKSMGAASSGREIVKQSLDILPDSYNVLSNVEINHAGKNTVLDTIVVGETGVYIVNTCNRKGRIEGQQNDDIWIQYKTTDADETYENKFKNPFKKLYFQKKFLEEFLRDNGIPVKVDGFLILPLAESYTCSSNYIGKDQKDIVSKIMNRNKEGLNSEQISRIIYELKHQ